MHIKVIEEFAKTCRQYNLQLKVFITDKDLGLKNALRYHFPNVPQRLCLWHINDHINTQSIKRWDVRRGNNNKEREEIQEERKKFLSRFHDVRICKTVDEFNAEWQKVKGEYAEERYLLSYIERTWMSCKDEWAEPWVRYLPDFGNTATSRAEQGHGKLKSLLGTNSGHIYDVTMKISRMAVNQAHEFHSKVCAQEASIKPSYRAEELKDIIHNVSRKGLDLLLI